MTKPVSKISPVSKSISVISLDDLRPAEKLIPGEPREIASGVTVSVMQAAAEALLEIQENAAGTISIDNLPANELATVRPGQIIKTSEGRYVLVRHLQAMIVPRDKGYERPEHVKKMIELALASLQTTSPEPTPLPEDTSAVEDTTAADPTRRKRLLRLSILGLAALIVGGLCLAPADEPEKQTSASAVAKSRIIAAAEQAQDSANQAVQASAGGSPSVAVPKVEAAEPPVKAAPQKKTSAVDALRSAMSVPPATVDLKKLSRARESNEPPTGKNTSVQLTDKDRQTIVEYKLEAKFDRSKARVKLHDMAKSFPIGSPARAEVERALNSM